MPASRPADRRERILAAAAELFCDHGFHNVSMAGVAASVGITAPALYRHFGNKQDLLLQVVTATVELSQTRLREAPGLELMLRDMAARHVAQRWRAIVWQREARHLPAPEHERVLRRLSGLAGLAANRIREARPQLSAPDSRLLAWAVFAINGSVAWHRVSLPRRRLEDLLYRLSRAAAECPLGPTCETAVSTFAGSPGRAGSRREQLLIEAVRLFDERGFQSVSIDDIGHAAGVTGPSLYKHFSGKTDILLAAVARGCEQRRDATEHALAGGGPPHETIRRLLDSYIGFAVRHNHLLGLLVNELGQMPDKHRRAARQAQRDYLALWTRLLAELRPDADVAELRITVSAVLNIVDNVVRTGRLRRNDLATRLTEITHAVLSLPPPPN